MCLIRSLQKLPFATLLFTQNPLNCPTNYRNMQAIRNIYKVENGKLTIELPASFPHKEVEVIILPVAAEDEVELPNAIDRGSKAERLAKLEQMSVWGEDEEQAVIESQNFINQWKIVS